MPLSSEIWHAKTDFCQQWNSNMFHQHHLIFVSIAKAFHPPIHQLFWLNHNIRESLVMVWRAKVPKRDKYSDPSMWRSPSFLASFPQDHLDPCHCFQTPFHPLLFSFYHSPIQPSSSAAQPWCTLSSRCHSSDNSCESLPTGPQGPNITGRCSNFVSRHQRAFPYQPGNFDFYRVSGPANLDLPHCCNQPNRRYLQKNLVIFFSEADPANSSSFLVRVFKGLTHQLATTKLIVVSTNSNGQY